MIDYCLKELLEKFKSELEKKENYYDDDVCFPPFKRLEHLEILNETKTLCNCIQEEVEKRTDKKAYLEKLKNKHEELFRKPLFNLIDEVYYYLDNIIPLHSKERKATGIFLKPAYECSEDFINEHQAIKTYRYHLQSTGETVICDYAFDAINEIWNEMAEAVKWEIEDITPPQTPKEEISLPEELNTEETKELFGKIKWCVKDGNLYRWTGTAALFGYFVDRTSDKLDVRPSNDRLPWKLFKKTFQLSDKDIETAKQAVNDYKNKSLSKPEGHLDIEIACK